MLPNPLTEDKVEELERLLPGRVEKNVQLSSISRWKIGGLVKVLISPENESELCKLYSWLSRNRLKSIVVGETSNLLFSSDDISAVVVKLGKGFCGISVNRNENLIYCGAGAWVPNIARRAMKNELTGIEHICGIPGTIGGLVYMNGGSMRRGIGENIHVVNTIRSDGTFVSYTAEQCEFGYRSSIFQNSNEIISSVVLSFGNTLPQREIRRKMLEILKARRKKFPRRQPNCGSVFVSNPDMYERFGAPGKIIDDLGLKGVVIGGAMVSPEHGNFIVNSGFATSSDVLELIREVRSKVMQRTGYLMKVEVKFVDPLGNITEI